MENVKVKSMRILVVTVIICILMKCIDSVKCPYGCVCENDVLRANCSGAGLSVVPIQLNPELHVMDLSNNKISTLYYAFSFYAVLEVLNLSKNKIKTLGHENFMDQRTLHHLNLSDNLLESLSKDAFKGLSLCTYLDLSNNLLEKVHPECFRHLPNLTVLILSHNKLDVFEENTFSANTKLRELYLEDNEFMNIPPALSHLIHLRLLSLASNLIEVIEDTVPNLSQLSTLILKENMILEIKDGGLSKLTNLEHLDLSDNNMTTLPTNQLAKLSRLLNLNLCGNSFDSLPAVAFRGLFYLKYLFLSRLESLQYIDNRAFVDNINVERITMDYNVKITKLPVRLFHGNPKLKSVSIRYNSVKTFEASHFPLDEISELRLGGNLLECNCSLGWLWHLLQESNSKKSHNESNKAPHLSLDVDEITCATPDDLKGKLLIHVSQRKMDCSMGWIAILSISCTALFIIGIITGVLIYVPKKKPCHLPKNGNFHLPPPLPPARKSHPMDLDHANYLVSDHADRYKIPSHPIPQNQWGSYPSHNIYEQLNENGDKPHIVYV